MDKLMSSGKILGNVAAITIILIAIGACRTLYPMHSLKMTGLQDTLLADRDGNRYPIKKMLDNNLWMTANLKLNIPDSYCYENVKENCEQWSFIYMGISTKRM